VQHPRFDVLARELAAQYDFQDGSAMQYRLGKYTPHTQTPVTYRSAPMDGSSDSQVRGLGICVTPRINQTLRVYL
jgi:hypothetical protein